MAEELGNITVSVESEGAEQAAEDAEAAGEAAEGDQALPTTGGGGSGDDGGLSQSLRGGIVGGLLSQAIGPLLEVLDPILQILEAFLAPVAVMLLRVLQPILRLLVRILPFWLSYMEFINGMFKDLNEYMRSARQGIWQFVSSLPGRIWEYTKQGFNNLQETIQDKLSSLPGDIASGIASRVPVVGGGDNSGGGGGPSLPPDSGGGGGLPPIIPPGGFPGIDPSSDNGGGNNTPVNISLAGGLDSFVEEITTNDTFNLP